MQDYPVYPSVKIAVPSALYMDAIAATNGLSSLFFDGETILVPESQTQGINLLVEKFKGTILERGAAKEHEYATLAKSMGVDPRLVSLGNAVWDITGQSAAQMAEMALQDPDRALNDWGKMYRASMED